MHIFQYKAVGPHPHDEKVAQKSSSAVAQAFGNSVIRDHLVACTENAELHTLGQLDHDFYARLHTPKLWARRCHPATLQEASKRIVCHLQPLLPHGAHYGYHCIDASKADVAIGSVQLSNERWDMIYDRGYDPCDDARLHSILDEVTSWHMFGHGSGKLQPDPQGPILELIEANRPHAYAFLVRRGYRLSRGLPVTTFSPAAQGIRALFIASTFAILALHFREALIFGSLAHQGQVRAYRSYLELCVPTLLGALYGVMLYSSGEAALQNALWGGARKELLDRYARDVTQTR